MLLALGAQSAPTTDTHAATRETVTLLVKWATSLVTVEVHELEVIQDSAVGL